MEVGHLLAENGLLQLVHQKLDERYSSNERPYGRGDPRLFHFIKIIEYYPMPVPLPGVTLPQSPPLAIPCKETNDDQNMHPWVVFRTNDYLSNPFILQQILHYTSDI